VINKRAKYLIIRLFHILPVESGNGRRLGGTFESFNIFKVDFDRSSLDSIDLGSNGENTYARMF
jgi:hypothetical protein